MEKTRRPVRSRDKKWSGLFPWKPRFPSRISGAWDTWYRDWIINGPMKARITKEQLEELEAKGLIK